LHVGHEEIQRLKGPNCAPVQIILNQFRTLTPESANPGMMAAAKLNGRRRPANARVRIKFRAADYSGTLQDRSQAFLGTFWV
jgi:hypothetical protein